MSIKDYDKQKNYLTEQIVQTVIRIDILQEKNKQLLQELNKLETDNIPFLIIT